MSFQADEVRELVECLYSAIDRRDWSTLEELVSPRVVVEVGSAGPIGWDPWLTQLREFSEAFPDGRHVIEEVFVDGSHGVSRCRFLGTHRGVFRGIAPTGNQVSVAGIHIDRFRATRWWPIAGSSICTGCCSSSSRRELGPRAAAAV